MQTIFWLILLPGLLWALLYFRTSLLVGTIVTAIALANWSYFISHSIFAIALVWISFFAIAISLNNTSLRRAWISDKALKAFRKVMPAMSQTERDALEAGTVWWDGELFSGKPDWHRLLDTPEPELNEEEKAFINGPVQELCEWLDDWHITQQDYDLPEEVWQFMKDKGFFGMIIPKQYGGLEFSALGHSSVVMKIAGRSITAAVTVMVPNSLGPAELLMRYGTQAQKDFYLKRLAKGEEVPCFALTSPEAGSDAASMTDTGVVCYGEFNGKQNVLGIRLNWDKRYITLGPVATVLGLAFKLYDPDHLLGDKQDIGITCALIPTDTPGVEIGNRHFPLNSAFQNGPNRGKDVFIPMDWVIGGQEQVGHGWRMLMECLAAGRSISLPALSTGAGKLVSRATGAYARVRQQFKTPIGKFEGVEDVLARIAGMTYMMDATRTLTTSALDQGEHPSVISAIVKYNLTETMRTLVNDAMDIHGGNGICMGPRNLMGRVYQSIPISITVEGANILTRSLIIFGQGAIRCHPYIFREMSAANEKQPAKASADFDEALFQHIGFTFSNAARAIWLGITGARLVRTPTEGPSRYYFQQLTRMSSAFALVTDIAMLVLGGSLKRREKLSGRLADVLSHLYLASATLKRFEEQGRMREDVPLMRWSCEHSLRVMQQSLDRCLINFPSRPIAWILRQLIFPMGKNYRGPTDVMGHKAASILLRPSTARDRLTAGLFLPNIEQTKIREPLARLEYALGCVVAAEQAEKKLRAALHAKLIKHGKRQQQIDEALAQGLIDMADVECLQLADAARKEAITVDDFEPEVLARGKLSQSADMKNMECA
jgi:acyl-CoA dehydrogenase